MSTSVGAMHVLAHGPGNILLRACVDCGLRTGCFCDSCLAQDRMPEEEWAPNQPTPLCTYCDDQFGACHFCRGVPWAQPPLWEAGPPPRQTRPATAQGSSQCSGGSGGEAAPAHDTPTRVPEAPTPPPAA